MVCLRSVDLGDFDPSGRIAPKSEQERIGIQTTSKIDICISNN